MSWLALYFAFRSKRENIWRNCGILGIIAGIVSALWDWNLMHWDQPWHPEYAIVAGNSRLMAIAMLFDFVWGLCATLSIGWFGWICRWCFIWSKEKDHAARPPMTPLVGSLWRLGDFGWKLFLITGSLLVLLAVAIGSYALLPALVEKTLTFSSNPARPTATPALTATIAPRVERALPIDTPATPRVEKALPVPHYQTVPTATPYQTDVAAADSPTPTPTPRKHHHK
jgi:hypothetical protein